MPVSGSLQVLCVLALSRSHPPLVDVLTLIAIGVGIGLAILLATFFVARIAASRLRHALVRTGLQLNAAILVARVLWALVWTIGIVLVLYLFGVGLAPLAAFIGVVGLAAGLSLQSVLQNLVAGVYLLAERPFAIGDVIAVIGPTGLNHEGTVEDIQIRTTHLRSADDELILVPNAAVFTGVVTNRTAVGGHVLHLHVTLSRGVEMPQFREQLLPVLQQLPSVLPAPRPEVRVERVAKDEWTAKVLLWAGRRDAASEALLAIARAFPEATVSIPGP